jgi:hypothetical protein
MSEIGPILLASAALLVISVLGFVLVAWARRRWNTSLHPDAGAGFTLSDLRQMRGNGQISQEEYERARQLIIVSSQRRVEEEASRERLEG